MQQRHIFLLGAAKSGTTSLAATLNQHPEIYLSPAKETPFFQRNEEFRQGVEYYRKQYFPRQSGDQLLLDAAHRHLYLPWVPERIDATASDPLFLVILRDPVERAYSHYRHWRRSGRPGTETLSFEDALHQDLLRIESGRNHKTEDEIRRYQEVLDEVMLGLYRTYLDSGYYYEQIRRYTNRFGSDSLKVVFFEHFVENPLSVVYDIQQFLDVSESIEGVRTTNRGFTVRSHWFQNLLSSGWSKIKHLGLRDYVPGDVLEYFRVLNKNRKKEEEMAPLTERWLYDHFRPHNTKLKKFLECSLPEAWTHTFDEKDWEPMRRDKTTDVYNETS